MSEVRDTTTTGLEIAVIGMAGRFPGARDLAEFWRNIAEGRESISFFSPEELLAAGREPELVENPCYVRARGVLAEAELFDAEFFGYSPREAEIIDPQQRIFLECAWEALEDAGYGSRRAAGSVGVYGGASTNTYIFNLFTRPEIVALMGRPQLAVANERDFLCTRIAYKLGLEGPAVNVQTACSTSLVAAHLACQALVGGECDMALAGGVSISFPQESGYLYQKDGIASPDGHTRAFDESAGGTVTGSGVGLVVLKRLADALRDGDSIRAVIRGSAINNDGAQKMGFTAPRVDGQSKAIRTAQEVAQVSPETIAYYEAHGTATALGDPIEIAAATQAFRAATDERGFCALGSVKTNIGHLDAAAGIAGLIKAILALEHRMLPPSLHFRRSGPQIDFEASPFYVSMAAAPWPAGPSPRRAGVSSFGLGGTNAHMVLEESPAKEPGSAGRPWLVFPLSARTEHALECATSALADRLQRHSELSVADIAYTLQVGRRHFEHRRTLVFPATENPVPLLESRAAGHTLTAFRGSGPPPPVAFLLPGVGDHYPGMGLGLYRTEPAFSQAVDRCARLLAPELGLDLADLLYPANRRALTEASADRLDVRAMLKGSLVANGGGEELASITLLQPALFVLEYALAQLWAAWGIRPQAMLGYSLGEYVAACLAGVFSLEDALVLVARRARMIEGLAEGAMLAVPLGEHEIAPYLGAGLSLAAVNGPALSVVAGAPQAVAALEKRLAAEDVLSRRLRATRAFHSVMMEPIAAAFRDLVASFELSAPRVPYLSNVTGSWIAAAQATSPDYWVRHLLQPVRFADGVAELWREPDRLFLEVGPGQSLGSLALQQTARNLSGRHVVVASLRPEHERQPDEQLIQYSLARLWLAGVDIDWPGFYAGERRRRVPLPTYPFERQRFWIERQAAATPMPPVRKIPDPADWFHVPAWRRAARPLPSSLAHGQRWLLLLDEQGVGDELARRLETVGQRVVKVKRGEGFCRLGERLFAVDPQEVGSYLSLLTALDETPRRIIHLWCLGEAEEPAYWPAQATGFHALLALVRALGERGPDAPVEICTVVDGVLAIERSDRLIPERATLLGALQVIPQEHPDISCRLIDLDSESPGGLVERLLGELGMPAREPVVALRGGGQRWVPDFAGVHLEPGEAPLREEGVYLITGGLGGIGLGLAELLARKVHAKLVLTGRSAVPERADWSAHLAQEGEWSDRLRRLQAMEASGAEVLALRADVANEEEMRSVITRCRERFGTLHGVLHAAGLPGVGLIRLKTREAADRVMAPKTVGTLVLERVLHSLPIDFLALFSSQSSIIGGLGQVDYAAANAFLDVFAESRAAACGCRTIAIDWCEWQWDGWTSAMLLDAELQGHLDRQRQAFGLTFEEGFEALCRALASGLPRLVVSTRDFAAVRERRHSIIDALGGLDRFRRDAKGGRPRSMRGTPYVAPRTDLERTLAGLWQEVLGVEAVGIEDDFLAVGGHSLLALQTIARIHAALRVDVGLHTLLANPTVRMLAAEIAERQACASAPPDGGEPSWWEGSRVPDDLDELSDDQVEGLLAQLLAEQERERV
jgi:acyl transferase domain-containing protein